ncbi:hypothetical protein VPFG_00236 [Vibrio phage nt-1]|uniref:Uncharacterized protein n=1 Tax=Vibrio phage nt-1 TaxID=115992 RepID=R9TIM4_9CAUD|nr:hypothetical protein VPFG_00236 [Vibrio phage nt-1]AGN30235.1 hypothetical protein VPFG_00236 [Vibrio phage nt-1]
MKLRTLIIEGAAELVQDKELLSDQSQFSCGLVAMHCCKHVKSSRQFRVYDEAQKIIRLEAKVFLKKILADDESIIGFSLSDELREKTEGMLGYECNAFVHTLSTIAEDVRDANRFTAVRKAWLTHLANGEV